MDKKKITPSAKKLIKGYENILKRTYHSVQGTENKVKPKLKDHLQQAKKKSLELEELTDQEGEKIVQYLERDIQSATDFIVDAQEIINEKLTIDMMFAEEKIANLLLQLADKTTVEYLELQDDLAHHFQYHSGEITSHGTLQCNECGQKLHFNNISQIPDCPKCHKTVFNRVKNEGK